MPRAVHGRHGLSANVTVDFKVLKLGPWSIIVPIVGSLKGHISRTPQKNEGWKKGEGK